MTKKETKKLIKSFIIESALCMQQFVRDEIVHDQNWTLSIVVTFNKKIHYSTGGRTYANNPCIDISAALDLEALLADCTITHTEYPHITNDPIIGEMDDVSVETAILATVAHEIAHAVYFTRRSKIIVPSTFKSKKGKTTNESQNHSRKWQYVYSLLRTRFVNWTTEFCK